jgi:hypothetical protein
MISTKISICLSNFPLDFDLERNIGYKLCINTPDNQKNKKITKTAGKNMPW